MRRILPTSKEWHTAFDLLSKKEKITFLLLFIIAWITGVVILIRIDNNYSTKIPAPGGSLIEGVVGAPRFVNPLLAVSGADRDLTRLVYAGLMRADGNGGLEPELAERYEISDDSMTYTFFLKDNLFWQDNYTLTADDIAFTINLAKNPKISSARRAHWEGVTVEVVNDREIKFHLRKPYTPFLDNTTLGILPRHLWENITPEQFNLTDLNIHPIGSGAYQVQSVIKNSSGAITKYSLVRFKKYRPRPGYLDTIEISFFPSQEALDEALANGTVRAAAIESGAPSDQNTILAIPLPRIFGIFFNQDNYRPLKDSALRQALLLATDRERIVRDATENRGIATSLPIPPHTFGYAPSLESREVDIEKAKTILQTAGYSDTDNDGIIEKIDKKTKTPIRFTIATSDSEELKKVANLLKDMWKHIGIDVIVQSYEIGDLEQSIIRPRNFDSLLFGQVVGYDPDPYAFWHTSQRTSLGYNIALYANTHVDQYLEEARTTTDPKKREELYRLFQEELGKDIPAIFLYSPTYLYSIPKTIQGVDLVQIPVPQERFSHIASWYTETRSIWNILFKSRLLQWIQ